MERLDCPDPSILTRKARRNHHRNPGPGAAQQQASWCTRRSIWHNVCEQLDSTNPANKSTPLTAWLWNEPDPKRSEWSDLRKICTSLEIFAE